MNVKIKEQRASEILSATEKLYSERKFKDITLKDISSLTSLTRSSIYNYYTNKEEIFLALLGREYEIWQKDLDNMKVQSSTEAYSREFASILSKRKLLFKILSTNFFEIEQNASLDALVSFKKTFAKTFESLKLNIKKSFVNLEEEELDSFVDSFFPFMFGIYPYTSVSDKQKTAMEIAKVDFKYYSVEEFIYRQIHILLNSIV